MDFINHVNNELQRRWEIAELKIDKYLDQSLDQSTQTYQQK